ncbi:unnamed protein product, partial [Ectocarpus fasciculatus]
ICSWTGVSCSGSVVSAIDLGGLGVEGTISPSVGSLLVMASFKINDNSFSGSIPSTMGSL